MRGTCSVGVILRAAGEADQVLADPYERIHAETMTPFAHMFWSAAWAGLAAGAVRRARNFVRVAARASGGKMPPAAAHLTHARVGLETLRGVVQSAIRTFERRACEANGLDGFDMQTSVNLLKVEASELAVSVVMSAMRACGLSGYRNDTEFTLGRHLRDVLSSPIMINNDRILANAEATVLMSEVPTALNF
jgi:acyl-CoA dehydrogenase